MCTHTHAHTYIINDVYFILVFSFIGQNIKILPFKNNQIWTLLSELD